MGKSDEKWIANYEAPKAYIDEHHHLPPKNASSRCEISPQLV